MPGREGAKPTEPPLSWEVTGVHEGEDGRTLVNVRWHRAVRVVRTVQRYAGPVLLDEHAVEETETENVLVDQVALPAAANEAEVESAIEGRRAEVERQYQAGRTPHRLAAMTGRRSQ